MLGKKKKQKTFYCLRGLSAPKIENACERRAGLPNLSARASRRFGGFWPLLKLAAGVGDGD